MSAHFQVSRQSLGRTFTVAAVVLGLIAVLQVGAVAWRLFKGDPEAVAGDGARQPPQKIDIQRLLTEMPPPEDPDPLAVTEDPLQGDPVTVGPTGPRPVPVATPLEPRPAVPEPKTGNPALAVLAGIARKGAVEAG